MVEHNLTQLDIRLIVNLRTYLISCTLISGDFSQTDSPKPLSQTSWPIERDYLIPFQRVIRFCQEEQQGSFEKRRKLLEDQSGRWNGRMKVGNKSLRCGEVCVIYNTYISQKLQQYIISFLGRLRTLIAARSKEHL